ncbi:MAG: peroxiredoxin family protein [Phycisphaerae bacterium]
MRAKSARKATRRIAPPPERREIPRPLAPPPVAPPLPPPIIATPSTGSTTWYGGAGEAEDTEETPGSDEDEDELRRSARADDGARRGAPHAAARGRRGETGAPGARSAKPVRVRSGAAPATAAAEWVDELGRPQLLAQYRGRRVVLTFLSFSRAGSGAALATGLRDRLAAFDDADAGVLVVSADSSADQRRIAACLGLTMPLISDPRGEAAALVGLRPGDSQGGAVSVVLDREGAPAAIVRTRDPEQHVTALVREVARR